VPAKRRPRVGAHPLPCRAHAVWID
jgi:hypothetical protein